MNRTASTRVVGWQVFVSIPFHVQYRNQKLMVPSGLFIAIRSVPLLTGAWVFKEYRWE
jgi:hypothetical protein